ncbi:MAG TPA: benzoate-CoA ligase family protein [Burkholderiales bacterium]|nr:benzoate-CoA ligase family protein [Burkholderiales bacterium]
MNATARRNASAHVDTFARDNLPPRGLWPELIFELPELRYPGRLNCGAELLDRMVTRGQGHRIALRTPEGECTYTQLLTQANRIANVLVREMGLKPGNRVLLRGPNNPVMAACWFAVMKAGGVCVATMPLLRAKELTDIITKAEVSHALCDRRLDAELKAALPACPTLKEIRYWYDDGPHSLDSLTSRQPIPFRNVDTAADDVALIAFTSGTTGKPKGTMHFHRDVIAMCDCFPRSCLGTSRDDIVCGTPPLAFTFGLGGLLCFPMRFGASAVLVEKLAPETLLETVQKFKATVLFTAPTMYRAASAIAGNYDLRSLRKCVSAGEALPDATRQLFKQATGIEIIDGIGSTEMIHIFISHTPERVRRGATGYAIPGYRATVLDEQGRPCKPGAVGRLAVKGPTGCRYLADERQKDYVHDGWNLTGDAYAMDEEGYFFYQARTDDMIISAGYNIAGPEVEGALLAHPAVAECGVVGWPDEERGTIVKAFVVLRPGQEKSEAMVAALQQHVKQAIAPYKYPRAIEFRDSLPRTETGKLQRFKLKTLLQPAPSQGETAGGAHTTGANA